MAQITFTEVVGQDSPNSGRAKINDNFATTVNQINWIDTQLAGLEGGIADLSSSQTFQNKTIYSDQAAGNIGNNIIRVGPLDILGTLFTYTNDFAGANSGQKSTIALLTENTDHSALEFKGVGGLEIFADNTAGDKRLTFGFNKDAHLDYNGDGSQTLVINASGIIAGYTLDANGNTLVRDKLGIGESHSGAPENDLHIKTAGDAIVDVQSTAGHSKLILDTNGTAYDGKIEYQENGAVKGMHWFDHTASDTTDTLNTVVNGTTMLSHRGDNKSKMASGGTLGFGDYSTWATASIHLHDGDAVIDNDSSERGLGLGGAGGTLSWITAAGGDMKFNKQGAPGGYTGSTEKMILKNTGDLGIGTVSPAERLHLYEAGGCNLVIDTDADSKSRVSFREAGSTVASWGTEGTATSDPYVNLYSNSTNSLKIYTADAVNETLVLRNGQVILGDNVKDANFLLSLHQAAGGFQRGIQLKHSATKLRLFTDSGSDVAGIRTTTNSDFELQHGTSKFFRSIGGGSNGSQPILGNIAQADSLGLAKNASTGDDTNKSGAIHMYGPGGLQEDEINWTLDISDPIDESGADANYGINSQRGIRIGFGGDALHAGIPKAHRAVGITAVSRTGSMTDVDMGFWTGGDGSGEFRETARLTNGGALIVNGTTTNASEKLRVVGGARVEGDMTATGNFTVEGNFTPGPTTYNNNTYFTADIVTQTNHDLSQSPFLHGIYMQQNGGYDKDADGFVGHKNHDQSHYAHFQIGNQTSSGKMSVYMPGKSQVILPAGNNSQRPQDGADDVNTEKGAIRYNTSNNQAGQDIGFEYWTGSKWVPVNCPPIGATYVQWYEAQKPEDIWPNTSWTTSDIASGAFIRNAGGHARTFSGTKQDQQLMVHEHVVKHPYHGGQYRRAGRGDSRAFGAGNDDLSTEPRWEGDVTANYEWGNLAKSKGVENRPENETVKF